MLPLNDEWLSWPPESLDSFFASNPPGQVAILNGTEEHEAAKQIPREYNHETSS